MSCAKPGTDHHHSCEARLQLQQHATVSATVVLTAPSQLIDSLSLFTENKELYSGDVMVLPVSKRTCLLSSLVSGADVMGSSTSFHHLLTAQPHTWSGRVQGTPSSRKP